jgi:hypothetical protein
MAKDYFKDLKFNKPDMPEEFMPKAKKEKVLPSAEDFKDAHRDIMTEIEKMQNGTSTLSAYPIHLRNGTCPAINILNLFMANPTEKLMLEFFHLAAQDFGYLAAKDFKAKIMEVVRKNG